MTDEPRKKSLIDLLERGRREEHSLWDTFTEPEKEAQGTWEHWAIKDNAAHISEWKDRDAARLEAAREGGVLESRPDLNKANAEIYELHREKSWAEIMALEERAFDHLMSSVEALSEEALFDRRVLDSTSGLTLAGIATDIGYQHPQEHLSSILSERGDTDGAESILARMIQAMASIDDSPRAHGTRVYNLACFYATHAMPDRALEHLAQSLQLRPDLADWSKQDSDMDSLRDLPAFQALVEA